MKNFTLLAGLLLFAVCSFAQKITRGPDVGEVYFLGPTHTGTGLYYSTDFGETAVCVDSTMTTNVMTVAADKSKGIIYYVTIQEGLYRSDDFGNLNSWQLVSGNVHAYIKSGVYDGYIYNAIVSHSENFGENFLPHSYNGFFGNLSAIEIDNEPSYGYAIVSKSSVPDSSYLLVSNDNYENLTQQIVFNKYVNPIGPLTRGEQYGELFTFVYFPNNPIITFKHSEDYGYSWSLKNELNISEPNSISCEGGRQAGEFYFLYSFINMTWQNAHIYMFYTEDYGQTFDLYHPFAKGNEPVLSNFSTLTKEVFLMEEIQFDNYSIGEINGYQWDFDNDGTIDSFDEFPVFTYQDTGYYSVSLTIVGQDSSNTFIRENYIHVIDTITNTVDLDKEFDKVSIYPNPFTDDLIIKNICHNQLEVYNSNGELIRIISSGNNTILWNGNNDNGKKCSPGIYYLKISNSIHKVILTK